MGVFSGIGSTNPTRQRGVFLQTGTYVVEVSACRHVQSQKDTAEYFCAEMDIIESNNPAMPTGTPATWMVKLNGKYPASALADVKAFVVAAVGCTDADVTEDLLEQHVLGGDGSGLAGERLRIVVEQRKTRSGTDFSKHYFSRYVEAVKAPAALSDVPS
jgi:hypothetical protein